MELVPTADGWLQPWPDGEPVELEGCLAEVSFVTSYLPIGAGPGKALRTVIQFEHLPPRVSQANLELTHLWRRDPEECGAYNKLKLTVVDADVGEFLSSEVSIRRLEEIPELELV
eukprot:3810570-Rhodomonas_salina.4